MSTGLKKYELSPYKETNADYAYSPHYAPADLRNGCKYDSVSEGMVVVCIDTDYYVDDWSKILGHPVPMLAFTFQPKEVAGQDGDSVFRIENNEVKYEVGGGSLWEHRVWNWCSAGEFIKTPPRGWGGLVG